MNGSVDRKKVVFFTGAGVSVGAGLPTYRGAGGIYSGNDAKPVLHADNAKPDEVWKIWEHLDLLFGAVPKPAVAHDAIAALGEEYDVCVVTQNIDDLHCKAAKNFKVEEPVFELHGNAFRSRCLNASCLAIGAVSDSVRNDAGVPLCAVCGFVCRPDVVLFGEQLPASEFKTGQAAAVSADVLIIVGTSLDVFPAANIVYDAGSYGVKLVWINPAPPPVQLVANYPTKVLLGTADEVLPDIEL